MKPGDILGDYRLIRKLGEGGMSEVWLAEDSRIRHQVAVKVLHAQYARNPKIRKRLEIEAQALARLKHPNIVGMHHYIEHGDDVALVMEYVEGKNLDDYVRKETGPLPEEKLRAIFLQILDGIGYAHQQGIVHRDIKPSNFMITADGTVKVLDFGIAKVLEEGAEKLTRTGMRMGTTAYMSPEQVNVDLVDHLSDIYSLGVTLFFLATGRGVYEGEESDFKVQSKIVNEPLPAASGIYPGVPGYVERVIARATAKRKEERFPGCGEMRRALEGRVVAANDVKETPHPSGQQADIQVARQKWRKSGLGKIALVVLGILGVGAALFGWKVTHDRSTERERARLDSIARVDSLETVIKAQRNDSISKTLLLEKAFGLNMEMVLVEGGTFTMGCKSGRDIDCNSDESPAHSVTLGSYYIGKTEVTQAQWRAVVGSNPSYHQGCDNCPVEKVSWEECQTFVNRLNKETGKHYRLPTEAEWEYAARGGNKSKGHKYAGSDNLDAVGWYDDNADETHVVAKKGGNELGLYDMSGNVWEWCSDWYGRDYYGNSSKSDPKGLNSGTVVVVRGCGCADVTEGCRVSFREFTYPDKHHNRVGFRIARD